MITVNKEQAIVPQFFLDEANLNSFVTQWVANQQIQLMEIQEKDVKKIQVTGAEEDLQREPQDLYFGIMKQDFNQQQSLQKWMNIGGDGGQNDSQDQDFKESPKQSQDEFPEVFRNSSLRLEKNNNVPKHLMKKIVESYSTKGKSFFESQKDLLAIMNKFMANQRKKYREEKNWNNNLQAMRKIFGENGPRSRLRSSLTRKMAHSLIRSEIIPSVMVNPQIRRMRKSYLMTLKVQLLRTRNSELMTRTEAH